MSRIESISSVGFPAALTSTTTAAVVAATAAAQDHLAQQQNQNQNQNQHHHHHHLNIQITRHHQLRCYLCDTPKQEYSLVHTFSEVVCRGCVNFEGPDRVEQLISEARRMKTTPDICESSNSNNLPTTPKAAAAAATTTTTPTTSDQPSEKPRSSTSSPEGISKHSGQQQRAQRAHSPDYNGAPARRPDGLLIPAPSAHQARPTIVQQQHQHQAQFPVHTSMAAGHYSPASVVALAAGSPPLSYVVRAGEPGIMRYDPNLVRALTYPGLQAHGSTLTLSSPAGPMPYSQFDLYQTHPNGPICARPITLCPPDSTQPPGKPMLQQHPLHQQTGGGLPMSHQQHSQLQQHLQQQHQHHLAQTAQQNQQTAARHQQANYAAALANPAYIFGQPHQNAAVMAAAAAAAGYNPADFCISNHAALTHQQQQTISNGTSSNGLSMTQMPNGNSTHPAHQQHQPRSQTTSSMAPDQPRRVTERCCDQYDPHQLMVAKKSQQQRQPAPTFDQLQQVVGGMKETAPTTNNQQQQRQRQRTPLATADKPTPGAISIRVPPPEKLSGPASHKHHNAPIAAACNEEASRHSPPGQLSATSRQSSGRASGAGPPAADEPREARMGRVRRDSSSGSPPVSPLAACTSPKAAGSVLRSRKLQRSSNIHGNKDELTLEIDLVADDESQSAATSETEPTEPTDHDNRQQQQQPPAKQPDRPKRAYNRKSDSPALKRLYNGEAATVAAALAGASVPAATPTGSNSPPASNDDLGNGSRRDNAPSRPHGGIPPALSFLEQPTRSSASSTGALGARQQLNSSGGSELNNHCTTRGDKLQALNLTGGLGGGRPYGSGSGSGGGVTLRPQSISLASSARNLPSSSDATTTTNTNGSGYKGTKEGGFIGAAAATQVRTEDIPHGTSQLVSQLTAANGGHSSQSAPGPAPSAASTTPTTTSNDGGNINGNGNGSTPAQSAPPGQQPASNKYESLKCLICGDRLEDRHFVQCPTVLSHKFCFGCSKQSIQQQRLEIQASLDSGSLSRHESEKIYCPSGGKCLLSNEQSPWTFMTNEIETIFRENSLKGATNKSHYLSKSNSKSNRNELSNYHDKS